MAHMKQMRTNTCHRDTIIITFAKPHQLPKTSAFMHAST